MEATRPLTTREEEILDTMTSSATPGDEQRVAEELPEKLRKVESSRAGSHLIKDLLHNVKLLYAMLRDPDFTLAWKSKGIILGALLYFILPTDALPDFIPFIGYIDDGAVLGAVLKVLNDEIQEYKRLRS